MTALKAHVVNGKIGAAEGMSEPERAALEERLERSLAQAEAGDLIDADEVLDELRRS